MESAPRRAHGLLPKPGPGDGGDSGGRRGTARDSEQRGGPRPRPHTDTGLCSAESLNL